MRFFSLLKTTAYFIQCVIPPTIKYPLDLQLGQIRDNKKSSLLLVEILGSYSCGVTLKPDSFGAKIVVLHQREKSLVESGVGH